MISDNIYTPLLNTTPVTLSSETDNSPSTSKENGPASGKPIYNGKPPPIFVVNTNITVLINTLKTAEPLNNQFSVKQNEELEHTIYCKNIEGFNNTKEVWHRTT